uniref:Uncharacterized protein n=1 Tax=Timema cristinae TaxID=61476 RepID=A0A7R9GUY4_TIMCR|nr:unnamed protein product [Timema cristinae]
MASQHPQEAQVSHPAGTQHLGALFLAQGVPLVDSGGSVPVKKKLPQVFRYRLRCSLLTNLPAWLANSPGYWLTQFCYLD